MSIISFPILDCTTEEEFKKIFIDELVNGSLVFRGYKLNVLEDDFYHVCFERGVGGAEKSDLGLRRSRRMLIIKEMCNDSLPFKIIYQTERENKSLCILFEELETAVYLQPINTKSGKYLKLLTLVSFGEKVTKKIEKQRNQGEIIDDIEKVFLEAV
ncbi:MAG: hypothetical protein UR96_C0010G0006 [candidate division WS6 bacterium GW2011_GWC1_36_11]|uniref:Uncharacterized protein n=2 Tax=Candidatus Dojkabacteria TaxID=74243 RepID=A0A0G0DGK0_9BACT|nr:MAG: hypothetical protein UR96_C0010G0006 [candidate division WS6 bacterium GW2011_GWC1_36_11]KKQ04661.1 MAG: hypothetical protein US14_C0003G0024 [candidate division WS6 bacterium GW2011_WS6_36_26]KKQ16962.1 MAG: hypothetical protein US29_C0015G0006 [candidate division WS6 bacterium GW2011_GWF1_36_8]HAM96290.1 hypothetical protein [Patescibacteria group bacterium]